MHNVQESMYPGVPNYIGYYVLSAFMAFKGTNSNVQSSSIKFAETPNPFTFLKMKVKIVYMRVEVANQPIQYMHISSRKYIHRH